MAGECMAPRKQCSICRNKFIAGNAPLVSGCREQWDKLPEERDDAILHIFGKPTLLTFAEVLYCCHISALSDIGQQTECVKPAIFCRLYARAIGCCFSNLSVTAFVPNLPQLFVETQLSASCRCIVRQPTGSLRFPEIDKSLYIVLEVVCHRGGVDFSKDSYHQRLRGNL